MQSTGLMIFWLAAVLLMVPLSLWLLKRSGLAQRTLLQDAAQLKVVGQTGIGPGQRVVTVELQAAGQRTWLVLGVTAQQISPLHTLPAPEATVAGTDMATGQTPQPAQALTGPMPFSQAFSQVLRRMTERGLKQAA